jgi:hypothetical protein
LVLLLLGGFIGNWWGSRSAREVVAELQTENINAKLAGAQQYATMLQSDLVGVLRATLGDHALHKPVAEAVADLDKAIAALGATSGAPSADDKLATLKAVREKLVTLEQDRSTAEAVLANLEHFARSSGDVRALIHDASEQKSGIGNLYAELAADAAKAKDLDRARRLFATAAHLDPANRSRYERQLQSFDKTATLPDVPEMGDTGGSAVQGAHP